MPIKSSWATAGLVGLLLVVPPLCAEVVEFHGALVDPANIPTYERQAAENRPLEGSGQAPQWGTADWSSYPVGACEAAPRSGVIGHASLNCNEVIPKADGSASVGFPLDLPHGAHVQWVYIYYYDTHTGSNPAMGFWTTDNTGNWSLVTTLTPPAFSGGNNTHTVSFSHTVDNWNNSYSILAILDKAGAEEEAIYRMIVFYKLQVSPAPASATFTDVPTDHPFFRYVEALADAGITGGCGGGNYCPDSPLTRGQMAVFLSGALGLHYRADAAPPVP